MNLPRTALGQAMRFVASGVANTAITWVLFKALSYFTDYRVSYTISFVSGIFISYIINSRWVFAEKYNLRTALSFPVIYLLQYLYGVTLLWALVDLASIRADLALFVVIGTSVPLTFFMMKRVFRPARTTG